MPSGSPTINDVATLYGQVLGKAPTAVTLSDFDLDATPPDIQSVTTTSDLGVATTFAMGVRIAFSVDPHSAPVWDDVTGDAMDASIRRGRQHELDRITTSTGSFRLLNTDGNYWPDNGGGKFTGEVLPGKRVQIVGIYNGVTYYLFTGFIESWDHSFITRANDSGAVVDVLCADGLKMLAVYQLSSGSEIQEASGTRIGNVLDLISWPVGDRDLDAGQATVIAATFADENALGHLQLVQDTELGLLFVDGNNQMVFQQRHARLLDSSKTTSQATYGDDSPELPYQTVEFEHDDQRIFNDVRITRSGGAEQSASDATSQSDFGLRSLDRTGLLMAADSEAADQADYFVSRYKDAEFRIRKMTVRPQRDPTNEWPDVLGFELGDRITGRMNIASVNEDFHIEGIDHDYSATSKLFETNWWLSPTDGQDYWILDTSTLGTGAQTTRLAY